MGASDDEGKTPAAGRAEAECNRLRKKNAAQAKQIGALNKAIMAKKNTFKRAARRAMANRKRKEAILEAEIKKQNQEIIRLQQISSVREYKSCGKKTTFHSKALADLRAKQAGHRAYRCPHCGQWHLTSKGGKR